MAFLTHSILLIDYWGYLVPAATSRSAVDPNVWRYRFGLKLEKACGRCQAGNWVADEVALFAFRRLAVV